jgi:hypothetical protein
MLLKTFLITTLSIFLLAPVYAQDTKVESLRDVRAIHVVIQGGTDNVKLFKQELIERLAESNRLTIVAMPDEADATLSVNVEEGTENADRVFGEVMSRGTQVTQIIRLRFSLMSHEKNFLWSLKMTSPSYWAMNDEQARQLAKKVSRELLKSIAKADKKP